MAADVASTEEETVRPAPLAQPPTPLEALSAELAHEILNPLNCALLQLAVLRRRLEVPGSVPETVAPVAALVERSLRRLEGLVNDFLAGVQPRTGDPPPGSPDLRCQGGDPARRPARR